MSIHFSGQDVHGTRSRIFIVEKTEIQWTAEELERSCLIFKYDFCQLKAPGFLKGFEASADRALIS